MFIRSHFSTKRINQISCHSEWNLWPLIRLKENRQKIPSDKRVYWPPRFVLVTSRSFCFAKRDERTVHSHLPPYNFIIQKSLIESIHDKWTRKIENWSHKTILLLHLVSLYYIVLSCRSFCLLSNHLYLLCLRTTKNCIVCAG